MLLKREYREGMIDAAIKRAIQIPRELAVQDKGPNNKSDERPVFVVSFDPRLPNISAIQNKHWRTMVSMDAYMAEVFPEPPLTAFKRPKNIKEYLVRAKVRGENTREKRKMFGMSKCNKPCQACPFIKEGNVIKYGKTKSGRFSLKLTVKRKI